MKFTVGWLKEHLDTQATLNQIVEKLTMVGLEVEKVTDRAKGLETFVVGYVVEAKQHPNADRLRVCQVDTGTEKVELVCGAPNAKTGMRGVFAPGGSYIPGTNITLKPTEIRGVMSNGMLLSEREMGISDEHDGIIELNENAKIGDRVVDVMGLNDPIIEIAITPNRGDCLGVRGIARDLAAAGLGALKPLANGPVPGTFKSPVQVHLNFDEATKSACPHFVGRYIRGVQNGESPQWLKDKLLAIGLRPISALVDITNLLTMDLGRPLHVFDVAHLDGDVQARMAKPGEKLLALNGKEYTLGADMCVIADNSKVEALGGVMGGEASGCTETTTDVYVECAYFDPIRTATTGRKLQVISDARFRFERGVDPAFLETGMEIATRLIMDLCGGEPSEIVNAGTEANWKRDIALRPERIKTLGGIDIPLEEIERILIVLGFGVGGDNGLFKVAIPSWRSDIVGEACLVEEVVRIYGFDKIPVVPVRADSGLPQNALLADQKRHSQARRVLAKRGMVEAVTYSFLSNADADLFGGAPDSVKLVNPISSDLDVMRPSLLPNLLNAANRNAARGMNSVAMFEVGPQFKGDLPEDQLIIAAGIRTNQIGSKHWNQGPRTVDIFDAKADALAVLDDLGAPAARLQAIAEAPAWYHPGRSGALCLGPKNKLAYFGEIHPGLLKRMGIKGQVIGFEIFVDALPKPKAKPSARKPHLNLPQLHAVDRDFAFVVNDDVAASAIINAAIGTDKKLITNVSLFDVFSGGNLGKGKKSIAISVTMQPIEQTLTDAEIDAVAAKIIANVAKSTGGSLRG
ncbi:MAG: phenylalanine--tRNA ligase subunit beta [Rhodospirillales bacterium]|nr:phenylalanine--tRNA ligase subunit beta [Rhodospirillales bacterium]